MNVKPDKGPNCSNVSRFGATPITTDELLANFEPTLDRCAAGETFVIIRDGEPTVYMVPYGEYLALKKRSKMTAETLVATDEGSKDA